MVTETSQSLDSARNERRFVKKEAAKEPGNTWGSLVNVLYGLENEKVMKLGPDHFRRNDNIYESQETAKRRGQRRAAVS